MYAYYKGECKTSDADTGTVLRFLGGASQESERAGMSGYGPGEGTLPWPLPGLDEHKVVFDGTGLPAYRYGFVGLSFALSLSLSPLLLPPFSPSLSLSLSHPLAFLILPL